jgi:hypothetical protein
MSDGCESATFELNRFNDETQLYERLNNPYSLPTFRWAERYGFILECRNNYIDNDLKFTGLNAAGTGYSFQSNDLNPNGYLDRFQKDLHGLLVDDYTIRTDVKNLSSGVRVFGVAMTGFLADERYSPGSVSVANLPLESKVDLLKYLAQAPENTQQAPYVGFKKYLMWSTQRNEIPDQQVQSQSSFAYLPQVNFSPLQYAEVVLLTLFFLKRYHTFNYLTNGVFLLLPLTVCLNLILFLNLLLIPSIHRHIATSTP